MVPYFSLFTQKKGGLVGDGVFEKDKIEMRETTVEYCNSSQFMFLILKT